MRAASRLSLVSSFFALMTHQLAVLWYPGACAWKNSQALLLARKRCSPSMRVARSSATTGADVAGADFVSAGAARGLPVVAVLIAGTGGAESEELAPRRQAARLRAGREKRQRLKQALEELKQIRAHSENPEPARASQTDAEARIMQQPHGACGPAYNVQISTDAQEKIIVAVEQ